MKRLISGKSFFPILVFQGIFGTLSGQDRPAGLSYATRSEVIAGNAMAATSHPLATQVALEIMRKGGTAVDAAIAANACLGLMEPVGCGIGGDLFAIVWDAKSERLYGLNASGRSPDALNLDYFLEKGMDKIPSFGPLSVSVPGCVDGWFELHSRFGRLGVEEILQPAIDYARKGFPLTEIIAHYLRRNVGFLAAYPGIRETYMPDGLVPVKGEIFRNPLLANTLEKIARGGRDAFYRGDIARIIDGFIREQGGFLNYDDLAAHRSEWVEPVSVNYRGYDVWELPPNGQGIAALQILNILELHDVSAMGFGSADYIHLFVEAKKLAFEDRARYYADPDFSKIPVGALLSKDYARERSQLIDRSRAANAQDPGILQHGETIYLTTADSEGNMVSLIQSNYRGMGSGMCPPGLGFVIQNRGESFSLEKGHPNVFEPRKRPFHTIIPCFVTVDGRPWLSFGVMGGPMQPQGHVQILVNLIDFGMNFQEAGDAPRINHDGSSEPTGEHMKSGGIVYLESGFGYDTVAELMRRGHKIQFAAGEFGGYQAIYRDGKNGVYIGASESRKDGQAAGY